jgi:hypothetical protein
MRTSNWMMVLVPLTIGILAGRAAASEAEALSTSKQAPDVVSQEPRPSFELAMGSTVSPWVGQVLKLADAGTDEVVVRSFIDSAGTFNLTAGQITKLSGLGVPAWIVAAMLTHDTELSAGVLPQPGPPPVPMLPRLSFVKTNTPPVTSSSTKTSDTIVNPSPAEDVVLAMFYVPLEYALADQKRREQVASAGPTRPVREPYPVPLTDTIRVFKASWRAPNVQVVEWFP